MVNDITEIMQRVATKATDQKPPPAKYQFVEGRFRADALRRYFRLVQYQAANPTFPHWKVGYLAFMDQDKAIEIAGDKSAFQHLDADQRKNLSNGTRRSLERARMIAENAARGRFPTHEVIKTALRFDFRELQKGIDSRNKWECKELQRLIRLNERSAAD